MKGLRSRVLVLFIAAGAVGTSIAYVGFVVWGQRQVEQARRAEMRAAAERVLARLSQPRTELHQLIDALARERGIWVSVAGEGIPWLRSGGAPSLRLPDPEGALGTARLERGFVHTALPVPDSLRPWTYVIASRPANDVFDRVYDTQSPAFIALALAFLAMVGTGVLLARRSLLAPFERLSGLVAASDHAGLRELGGEADSFAALGRSIAGMSERIAGDRERIAEQLEALREAHGELSRAQDQLIRAERLAVVGTLAAGLAHEIGNPLTVVGGFVELLGDPELGPEERSQARQRAEQELDRIQSIVRDLLDFSRAPAQSEGSCTLDSVFADLRELLAPQRRFTAVTVETELDHAPPVAIDEGALLQILINLCLNAADAMEGRGTLRISARGVGPGARLQVEDSGPGIPEPDRARVFEPFFTTKPAGLGTGLGLAVCERIVEAVGGALSIESSHALGGACFVLELPRAEPSDQI